MDRKARITGFFIFVYLIHADADEVSWIGSEGIKKIVPM